MYSWLCLRSLREYQNIADYPGAFDVALLKTSLDDQVLSMPLTSELQVVGCTTALSLL